jgi:hypothetical protein
MAGKLQKTQKNHDAIRKLREENRLAVTKIRESSYKQPRRIECVRCRLTSNAAKELAKARGMTPNQ